MTWEGYNYEDAVLLSERLVEYDVYTSVHIEEYEVESRDTKLGPEMCIRDRVYTGAIDAYFDYSLGALEYRSVRFETELLDTPVSYTPLTVTTDTNKIVYTAKVPKDATYAR